MDRLKETNTSTPGVGKAKKSTSNVGSPAGEPRRNIEDVIMGEPIPYVPSVGGSISPTSSLRKRSNPIALLSAERSSSGARQPGHTFPQMRTKKSMATKAVQPLVSTKSVNTPRVRFSQVKSTSVPRSPLRITPMRGPNAPLSRSQSATPGRKAGSSFPFQKQKQQQQQQGTASGPSTPHRVKTARPILPLWQQLDEEHERVYKRKRDVRRISSTNRPRQNTENNNNQLRKKAQIAPKLRLRLDGETLSSSSEDEDHRQRRQPQMKVTIDLTKGRQIAAKKSAARKIETESATSSDESIESGPESSMDTDSQADQLFPEEYDLPPNQRFADDRVTPLRIFHPAPQITIPLPQVKAEPEDEHIVGELGPSEELLNAVEALTIGPIRMQATRQLPFLRRNLRRGFVSRCGDVLIPIHPDQRSVSLQVTYEHVDGVIFRAEIEDWLCPLCNLFGKFTTQATLYCHLKWDHQEIFSEWKKVEESDVLQKWDLQVVIPQDVRVDEQAHRPDEQDEDEDEQEREEEEEEKEEEIPDEHTPGSPSVPASESSTPFPHVSLPPLSSRQQPNTDQEARASPVPSTPKIKPHREISEPLTSRSVSIPQPPSSRSRSMTRNTIAATTTTTATPRIRDTRYPTPPPPDDPLGPSARPPYLPAYSEYGGPTVFYSCRPGGPCLFDLLGTLPMKEFGVLEWQVIDSEEEIYESDDVKEEYKIMHALWLRWIIIHRNEFVSNYFQGTLAFVDYYWRMIHRAAGWDALRYWLLILLCDRFLNAHEVAQVLIHYEGLTGMASWYC